MRPATSGELRWLGQRFADLYFDRRSYLCPVCEGPLVLSSAGDRCLDCKAVLYPGAADGYRAGQVPDKWFQPWVDTPAGRYRVVKCPECGGHPCVDAEGRILPHCRPVLISQEHPEWGWGADWCPAQGTKVS